MDELVSEELCLIFVLPPLPRHLLLGLACNESTAGLYLDLSSNSLGASGAHVLESCIHGVRVLHGLDISENSKWMGF